MHRATRARRRGLTCDAKAFTLVEVLLAILVMGTGLVASMRALAVILKASEASRNALVAQQLAVGLLVEIALLPYEDPVSPTFGPEGGEVTGTRSQFDDIDDYDGWTASPPQKKDGTAEPGASGYTRSVLVVNVDMQDLTKVVADGSSDAKSVTVTVTRPGMTPVSLTAVRLKGANREDAY